MRKYLTALFILTCMSASCAYATDDSWAITNHYQQGSAYLKSYQYSSAIAEYKKALRLDANDFPSRTGLINSYLARATYYNNTTKEFTKAANDLRSALFYLKYYGDDMLEAVTTNAIPSTEQNLNTVLSTMQFNKAPKNRLYTAKLLRNQGEFAASATECYYALQDYNLQKSVYPMLGDLYVILDNKELAMINYEKAVNLNPKDLKLVLNLAKAYDNMGEIQKAADRYNEVLTKGGNNPDILYSLEKIWVKKIEIEPDNAEAYANLGAVYQKKGDLSNALTQYQKSIDLNPKNTTTRLNLGILYQQMKMYPQAIDTYKAILQYEPNNKDLHYYIAQSYKGLGDKENAVSEYKIALNLDPKNQNLRYELYDMLKASGDHEEILNFLYENVQDNKQNPDSVYQFAYELHKANKLQDAIIFYNDAIKLNPQMKDAYINKAQAYKQLGQFDNAFTTIDEGLQQLPQNQSLITFKHSLQNELATNTYNEASKYFETGDYLRAITEYNKISPQTGATLLAIGASYDRLGDTGKALEYYKKSFEKDSQNAEVAFYIASSLFNEGKAGDALIYAKKALAIKPDNQDAKNLFNSIVQQNIADELEGALALYDKQKYPEALASLNTIIKGYPNSGDAYYYRGMVYDAQKNYNLAISDYLKALTLNKNLVVAYYSLGVDYDYLKQYKNAVLYYKKYLTNEKEANEYTKYAQTRVQALRAYE